MSAMRLSVSLFLVLFLSLCNAYKLIDSTGDGQVEEKRFLSGFLPHKEHEEQELKPLANNGLGGKINGSRPPVMGGSRPLGTLANNELGGNDKTGNILSSNQILELLKHLRSRKMKKNF